MATRKYVQLLSHLKKIKIIVKYVLKIKYSEILNISKCQEF
jgi:hypothetical protein